MATRQELLTSFGSYLESAVQEDSIAKQPHWLFGYAADWLAKMADEIYHSLGTEAEVEAFVREAYSTYVEPWDMPYVPNFVVEPRVDQAIEDALVKLVKNLHARLHPE